MRWSLAILGLAAAAAIGAMAAIGGGSEPEGLPEEWQKGMSLTAYQPDAFGQKSGKLALKRLARTGTTHVAIVVPWFMDNAFSTAIAPEPTKTPTDESVLDAMRTARSLGMTPMLKPHVDVRSGAFRGNIQPLSVGAWFDGYRAMMNHYAELGRAGGAELLSVGTELTSMSRYTDQFRRVIAGVRSRFDGQLTYAALRLDEAERIGFWDDLDLIGIDAYMPLRTPERPADLDQHGGQLQPTVDELVAAWQPFVAAIEALYERWQKPVVFTELGFESREGTAARAPGGEPSEQAQADAYEATYRAWSQVPWFRGIYWWDWSAQPGGLEPQEGTMSPAGKLAEQTIREWNGVAPPAATDPG